MSTQSSPCGAASRQPYHSRELGITAKEHPENQPFGEDVYYAHLIYRARRHRPLKLLRLSLSEWRSERPRHLLPADVWHKLKRPSRLAYLAERPGLLQLPAARQMLGHAPRAGAARSSSDPPTVACRPLTQQYRTRNGRATADLSHCCEQWSSCEMKDR